MRWATVPEGVIPLTTADLDFPCAPEIVEAITRYATDRYFSYSPPEGHSFFKEQVSAFFLEKRNTQVDPSLLFPVDSAASAIYTVCKSLLKKGDEAIVFDPVDFLFRYSIEAQKAIAVSFPIPVDPDEEVDFKRLERLITPKTKLICLCNPLNPTGKVFTRNELEAIGQIAIRHNIIVLSDEIWSDIVYDKKQYISIASLSDSIREQTIIVTGFSKTYGLAGLRAGVIIASTQDHFDQLLLASNHKSTVQGCNVLAQVAATAALKSCDYWVHDLVKHLTSVRNSCVDGLNSMKGVSCYSPQGCYLAFVNIQATGYSSEQISDLLLNKSKVAVIPGTKKWFGKGSEGYLRLSFGTSKEIMKEALQRIKFTVDSL